MVDKGLLEIVWFYGRACDTNLGLFSPLPRMPMTYMVVQCGRLMVKDGTLNIWSHGYLLWLSLALLQWLDRGWDFLPCSIQSRVRRWICSVWIRSSRRDREQSS
jgi:hypothetical protein